MEFSEGQTVVHPHHGPATITTILTRSFNGVPTPYLRLEIHRTSLVVGVPLDRAEQLGLRLVLDTRARERLFDVLREPTQEEEGNWSRRFKANTERLKLGDLNTTAIVVRDLTRRQEAVGLSRGEKDQLKHARKLLVVEIGLSCSLDDDDVESLITDIITGREPQPALALAAGL